MFSRILLALGASLLLALTTGSATALTQLEPVAPNTAYRVLDHPDGALAPPPYALRLDALNGDLGDAFTFSAELGGAALQILWDDEAGTLDITGTVYGGQMLFGSEAWKRGGQLFEIAMRYDRVIAKDDMLSSIPGSGSGSITALGRDGEGGIDGFAIGQRFALSDRPDHAGASLQVGFGDRVGDAYPVTGHGELLHDGIASNKPIQQWRFRVGDPLPSNPVPEPGTALLLGGGLALLARRR